MPYPLSDSHLLKDITDLLEDCSQQVAAKWAMDCAEHVLYLFSEAEPEDSRPEMALEMGRLWSEGNVPVSDIRNAAFISHAAARETELPEAIAAARAVGQAISTAHVKGHALHASTYAAKAAALAYPFDSSALDQERAYQYRRLIECMKEVPQEIISLSVTDS